MKVNFQYTNGRERVMSRRDAEILRKLGRGTYMTRDMRAQPVTEPPVSGVEDAAIAELRAEYQASIGKRPFHGWDVSTLRQKIAEAKQSDE